MTDQSHRPDRDGLLRGLIFKVLLEEITQPRPEYLPAHFNNVVTRLLALVNEQTSVTRDGAEGAGKLHYDFEVSRLIRESQPAYPNPAPDAMREALLYTILKKYLPQDARLDDLWQELKECQPSREPTPDMRIAGGIACHIAIYDAEIAADCADACWKAMWDVAYDR